MASVYEQRAKLFKALADERRQRILELLHSGEKCACVLIDALDMPQSSLSYHMKVLCESGIVIGREEGKWTHYRISGAGRDQVLDHLKVLTDASEEISDCCSCKCGK